MEIVKIKSHVGKALAIAERLELFLTLTSFLEAQLTYIEKFFRPNNFWKSTFFIQTSQFSQRKNI